MEFGSTVGTVEEEEFDCKDLILAVVEELVWELVDIWLQTTLSGVPQEISGGPYLFSRPLFPSGSCPASFPKET